MHSAAREGRPTGRERDGPVGQEVLLHAVEGILKLEDDIGSVKKKCAQKKKERDKRPRYDARAGGRAARERRRRSERSREESRASLRKRVRNMRQSDKRETRALWERIMLCAERTTCTAITRATVVSRVARENAKASRAYIWPCQKNRKNDPNGAQPTAQAPRLCQATQIRSRNHRWHAQRRASDASMTTTKTTHHWP